MAALPRSWETAERDVVGARTRRCRSVMLAGAAWIAAATWIVAPSPGEP